MPIQYPSSHTKHPKDNDKQVSTRKIIFILSPDHVSFPLNANMGTSHTSNQQNNTMNKKRNNALNRGLVNQASQLEIKAPQKIAFAGVGIPMNSVC